MFRIGALGNPLIRGRLNCSAFGRDFCDDMGLLMSRVFLLLVLEQEEAFLVCLLTFMIACTAPLCPCKAHWFQTALHWMTQPAMHLQSLTHGWSGIVIGQSRPITELGAWYTSEYARCIRVLFSMLGLMVLSISHR